MQNRAIPDATRETGGLAGYENKSNTYTPRVGESPELRSKQPKKLSAEQRAFISELFDHKRSGFLRRRAEKAGTPPTSGRVLRNIREGSMRASGDFAAAVREFFATKEKQRRPVPEGWARLRYATLKQAEGRCQLCGLAAKDGTTLHVDHIKPVSKYPELALEPTNLQVLCEGCNLGKSNRDETDWR